ncbi:MAG: hypothetical protein ACE5GH_07415 [Fidelibacterota bacterium]
MAEGVTIIMETVQAILTSWPFWLAVVAVAFFFLFRPHIIDVLRRVKGIGRGGITVAPHEQKTPATGDPRTAADELLARLQNQYVRSQEELIKKELADRGLQENMPETTEVLIRYTASALITAIFERTYSSIYGSQVNILNYLNSRTEASDSEIMPFYQAAVNSYPIPYAAYPFDQYMRYLIGQELVVQQANSYSITLKGRTFLLYLVNEGKPARDF